jgi:2-polyprenyl-3-methyl-5-hydroxy-6-metoxy-1,4-benzoquinol methylase
MDYTYFQDKYGNNWEREVYLDKETIGSRAYSRYNWASKYIKENDSVLDIGCSTGFGTTLLPANINYTGVDYDVDAIILANRHFGDGRHKFINSDIKNYRIPFFDAIIAFEFIEHISFGITFAQFLKTSCNKLFCSVPYNETKGLWGPHHVLHGLIENDFPCFEYTYMTIDGELIEKPIAYDGSNLMLLKWER